MQVVDVLAQNVGLPTWAFSMALVLLLNGLPIVVGTAYLHGRAGRPGSAAPARDDSRGRLLTWRNAMLGGVAAFALFGLSVGVYFALWAAGIGPIGSLVAKGILDEDDPVILADFANETLDPQMASVVTNTLRVDLEQSRVIRLLPEGYLANSLQRMKSLRSITDTEPLARVTTASLSALRKYSQALALEEDGRLLEAITLLEDALREDSAFAMVHRKLAVIHGNRGEAELRREYAAMAFEHRDRLTDLERHLASAYYYSAFDEPERAIQEYEAVLADRPG